MTSNENGTLQSAVQQFENLMTPEESKDQPTEPESQEDVEQVAEPVESEQVTEETTEEEVVEESPQEVEEPKYKVKANGEEFEVTLDELQKGYSRQSDYVKKTQTLAEKRRELETQEKSLNEFHQLAEKYRSNIKALEDILTSQNKSEDLEKLKETNPVQYAVKIAERSEKEKQLNNLKAEEQRVHQEQQQVQLQQHKKYIEEQKTELTNRIPDFAITEKRKAIQADMNKALENLGFAPNEVNVFDSRMAHGIWKIAQYDKLMGSKAGVVKKVQQAPKMIKAGVSQNKGTSQQQAVKRARAKLKTSGNIRDAQAIFEQLL